MGYVPIPGFACLDVDDDVMDFPCHRTPLRLLRARVVACPGLAATSFAPLAYFLARLRFVSLPFTLRCFPLSFAVHVSFSSPS